MCNARVQSTFLYHVLRAARGGAANSGLRWAAGNVTCTRNCACARWTSPRTDSVRQAWSLPPCSFRTWLDTCIRELRRPLRRRHFDSRLRPSHTPVPSVPSLRRAHTSSTKPLCPQAALHCFPIAPVTRGSSSSWWEVWSGTCHGSQDSSIPKPALHEPASDELVMNAVHRMQDRLQQTLVLVAEEITQNFFSNERHRSPKATLHMQPCRQSLWRADGRRRPSVLTTGNSRRSREAEEAHHDAIKRTLEKDRRAREARQDRDNEGGLLSGHRSGFLPNTRRARGGVCTGTQRTPLPTLPAPLHAEVTVRTLAGC